MSEDDKQTSERTSERASMKTFLIVALWLLALGLLTFVVIRYVSLWLLPPD